MPGVDLLLRGAPIPPPPPIDDDILRDACTLAINAVDHAGDLMLALEAIIAVGDNATRGATLTVVDGEPWVRVHGGRWELMRRVMEDVARENGIETAAARSVAAATGTKEATT